MRKDQLQRDYTAYRDWMYQKARRQGKSEAEARTWAQEQVNMQTALRQRELEDRQLKSNAVRK